MRLVVFLPLNLDCFDAGRRHPEPRPRFPVRVRATTLRDPAGTRSTFERLLSGSILSPARHIEDERRTVVIGKSRFVRKHDAQEPGDHVRILMGLSRV